jgi:hypothetical protein
MEKSPNYQLPKELAGFDAAIADLEHRKGSQPAEATR